MERGTQPVTELPLLPGMRSTALPVHAVRARRLRLELQFLVVLDVLLATLGFIVAYFLRYRYGFLAPGALTAATAKFPSHDRSRWCRRSWDCCIGRVCTICPEMPDG